MYRPTILLLPNTLYRLLKRKVENCICDTRVVKMRYNKTNNDLYVLTQENYQRKYSRLLNVFTSRSNSSDEGQLAPEAFREFCETRSEFSQRRRDRYTRCCLWCNVEAWIKYRRSTVRITPASEMLNNFISTDLMFPWQLHENAYEFRQHEYN
jgi:carboxypeptidase C (cathepsin A)